MTTDNQPQVPAAPPAAEAWLTTGSLVMIGIGIVLALLLILIGARLKQRRRAAERELQARRDEAPPAPPVTPSLAPGDMPVAAAAPLDATPASLAADLAPPASPPAGDADDLTRIKGLGPKLALRLGELGVTRYAQIADLDPAAAQALDAQLGAFRGRLERDRWIEQARYLARGDRDGFEAAFGRL